MAADPKRVAPGRLHIEAAGARVADLFESHSRLVFGICRLLLRDAVEAEDATQQTFLSAYRSLLAGTEPQDPAAWLGTIARNDCRSRIRSRMTEPLQVVAEAPARADVEHDADTRTEIAALSEALAGLPQRQREAIVLREFYGLSHEEVGAALDVSPSAVDALLVRARRRLQAELRPARLAAGALSVPMALRDALAQAIPGFDSASAPGLLAKLASLPVAAKLAGAVATVAVVGTAGTLVDREHGPLLPGPAAAGAGTHAAPDREGKEQRVLARLASSPAASARNSVSSAVERPAARGDDDAREDEEAEGGELEREGEGEGAVRGATEAEEHGGVGESGESSGSDGDEGGGGSEGSGDGD